MLITANTREAADDIIINFCDYQIQVFVSPFVLVDYARLEIDLSAYRYMNALLGEKHQNPAPYTL